MINNALVDSEADLTSANEQSLHETYLVTFPTTHPYSIIPSTKVVRPIFVELYV